MPELKETSDRSVVIVAVISGFVVCSFLASAQWISLQLHTPSVEPEAVASSPSPSANRPLLSRDRRPLIAVSRRHHYDQYDDMGQVLREMGEGYTFDEIPLRDLVDHARLSRYKVLFLGCAAEMAPTEWTIPEMQKFMRVSLLQDFSYADRVQQSLEAFVREGGALYASDWASTFLERAFSGQLTFAQMRFPRQRVEAKVVDQGLVDLIGTDLDLLFETDLWVAAQSTREGKTYLEGEVRGIQLTTERRPLLVSFPYGRGLVIFTSFHNQKQISDKEHQLLRYLVLKPIVAQVASQSQRVLVSQNFSVEKESLFSTGTGSPKIFPFKAVSGQSLTFLLSWNAPIQGEKACLELKVTSPSGVASVAKGETPPISVKVDGAETGDYRYSVEPVHVPFGNFPYVVSVGVRQ